MDKSKESTHKCTENNWITISEKEEEYPKFVRQELIVNVVTNRAYSIAGTDIQIKMFDEHMIVESLAKFLGLVRTDNTE